MYLKHTSFTAIVLDSPKDQMCIEILEQAERRDPLPRDGSLFLAEAGDNLRMKLLYLENRGVLLDEFRPPYARHILGNQEKFMASMGTLSYGMVAQLSGGLPLVTRKNSYWNNISPNVRLKFNVEITSVGHKSENPCPFLGFQGGGGVKAG